MTEMKLSHKDREDIIKNILGFTDDEFLQICRECDDSECSWCRWKHSCLFDDNYLRNVAEDLFR